MGKIKLNLASGAIVEKALICAFKANDNEYIVLDDETNGSMGLPIILVCKFVENKLTKILDQTEWQNVKEYLKNIIAGGQMEFIKLGSELQADDIYYTQLTLPVPSFDALKIAYKVNDNNGTSTLEPSAPVIPTPEEVSVQTTGETGILDLNLNNSTSQSIDTASAVNNTNTEEVTLNVPEIQIPVIENNQEQVTSVEPPVNPASQSVTAPMPEVSVPEPPVNPNVVTQTVAEAASSNLVLNSMPEAPITIEKPSPEFRVTELNAAPIQTSEPAPVVDVTLMPDANGVNEVNEAPVVQEPEVTPTPIITDSVFKEQKEAFMQACENMFDALVQKFEKELENRK